MAGGGKLVTHNFTRSCTEVLSSEVVKPDRAMITLRRINTRKFGGKRRKGVNSKPLAGKQGMYLSKLCLAPPLFVPTPACFRSIFALARPANAYRQSVLPNTFLTAFIAGRLKTFNWVFVPYLERVTFRRRIYTLASLPHTFLYSSA